MLKDVESPCPLAEIENNKETLYDADAVDACL
jgi:hypothetical protein